VYYVRQETIRYDGYYFIAYKNYKMHSFIIIYFFLGCRSTKYNDIKVLIRNTLFCIIVYKVYQLPMYLISRVHNTSDAHSSYCKHRIS